jgi:DegV family protein with EDD domain
MLPPKIAIVTDSTSDIPYDLAEKRQIHIVPNLLVVNGKSIEDGKDFSRRAYYEQLPELQPLPTTGTASSGAYEALYETLFRQGYQQILSIHASSLLSGIVNAASTAAGAFGERVRIFDSRSVTLGLGFQVLAAAEAAAEGLSLEAILARLEAVRPRARVVAMLDTLEYIRRSGRVSWARASLGNLLRVRLFVEVKNGAVQRLGEARTRSKGMARLLELMRAQAPFERLAILHTNAEADALRLLESFAPTRLEPPLREPPLLVNVTTVIGTHVGPNGLGFAAVVK